MDAAVTTVPTPAAPEAAPPGKGAAPAVPAPGGAASGAAGVGTVVTAASIRRRGPSSPR